DRYLRSCRLDSIRIRPLKWISRSEHDQVQEISVGPGSGNRIDPTDCQPCCRGSDASILAASLSIPVAEISVAFSCVERFPRFLLLMDSTELDLFNLLSA